MSLNLVITDVGRAALINAQNTGTTPVTISQVGVSASTAAVDHTTTALAGEIKRLATFGGQAVADDTLHISIRDESADAYTLNAFGLYLSDGTLFGVYSQATEILEKSAASILLLAVDVVLSDITATDITFGSTDFLNPPATHAVAGVARLATTPEAQAGADDTITITPAGLKAAINAALLALLPIGAVIDWWGTQATVPASWHICDGTNGTPNLLGKVRIGATGNANQGTAFDFGSTGGSATMTVTVQGHALTVPELPGHVHGVTDNGHAHGVADGGHVHGLNQNPHGHPLHDPGHFHSAPSGGNFVVNVGNGQNGFSSVGNFVGNIPSGSQTTTEATGIYMDAAYANISVQGAYTGIGIYSAYTNVSIQSTGGGAAHTHGATTTTNLPPYVAMWPIMRIS